MPPLTETMLLYPFLCLLFLCIRGVRADYYIDPTSVSLTTREAWCVDELATCPLICQQVPPGTTTQNSCDPTSLTYGCLCGNGMQPNISEYSLTLPYFVCQQWGTQCVAACGSDNACSSDCRQNHPCGALDPSPPNITSTASAATTALASSITGTSGASSTSSGGVVYTGLAGSTGTSTPDSSQSPRMFEAGQWVCIVPALVGLCIGGMIML